MKDLAPNYSHNALFQAALRACNLPGTLRFGIDLAPYEMRKFRAMSQNFAVDTTHLGFEKLANDIATDIVHVGGYALIDTAETVVLQLEGRCTISAKVFAIVLKEPV